MNRESTIDYSGRTVDLLLLKTVLKHENKQVNPNITNQPMSVTGIEKLVQRYALLFLTELGSVMNSPNEGTEFLTSLSRGKIYDESSLSAAANLANKTVYRQIVSEDTAMETPDDEALDDSSIQDMKMDRATASVSVTVKITSVAGESFVYTTPIRMGV